MCASFPGTRSDARMASILILSPAEMACWASAASPGNATTCPPARARSASPPPSNATNLISRGSRPAARTRRAALIQSWLRSEEHTSELQSPCNLVCRLLLEKKKKYKTLSTEIGLKEERLPPSVPLVAAVRQWRGIAAFRTLHHTPSRYALVYGPEHWSRTHA